MRKRNSKNDNKEEIIELAEEPTELDVIEESEPEALDETDEEEADETSEPKRTKRKPRKPPAAKEADDSSGPLKPAAGFEIPNPKEVADAAAAITQFANQLLTGPWENARVAATSLAERLEQAAKSAAEISAASSRIQSAKATTALRVATVLSVAAIVLSVVSLSLSQSVRTQALQARVIPTPANQRTASASPAPVERPAPAAEPKIEKAKVKEEIAQAPRREKSVRKNKRSSR